MIAPSGIDIMPSDGAKEIEKKINRL